MNTKKQDPLDTKDHSEEAFNVDEWICVDGLMDCSDTVMHTPLQQLSSLDALEREAILGEIGKYDTNGGLVAFVNREGSKFVGPSTKRRIQTLQNAGYKSGSVIVPFSVNNTDYAPKDASVVARLQVLEDQAVAERAIDQLEDMREEVASRVHELREREGKDLKF